LLYLACDSYSPVQSRPQTVVTPSTPHPQPSRIPNIPLLQWMSSKKGVAVAAWSGGWSISWSDARRPTVPATS